MKEYGAMQRKTSCDTLYYEWH